MHRIERDKPKLNVSAVPSLNLPSDAYDCEMISTQKQKKRRQQNVEHAPASKKASYQQISKTKWNEFYLDDEQVAADDDKNDDPESIQLDVEANRAQPCKETASPKLENCTTVSDEQLPAAPPPETFAESPIELNDADEPEEDIENQTFDSLYDDVFEIELPNTLWGLHRDPLRKFIVFSQFDLAAMASMKCLYVDHECVCRTYVHGKLLADVRLLQIGVDILSELITSLDEARICAKFRESNGRIDCKLVTNTYLDDRCSDCSAK